MIRRPKGPECHDLPSQTENLPERPPGSLCGDNPSGWAFGQMGQIHMGRANTFGALVAGHAADEFLPLREAVDERRSREEVGVGTLAEAAAAYRPDPGRPECGAEGVWRNGSTAAGVSRWRCRCCGRRFTSPTGTVLEHCRKPPPPWDFLHQAHAPQRSRRVCGRAVRRPPQDRLRLAAPCARHDIRPPRPVRPHLQGQPGTTNEIRLQGWCAIS